MSSGNKKYWRSVEELNDKSPIVETLQQKEFAEEIPTEEFLGNSSSLSDSSTSRRDFLKYVGFSTAAATVAACEGPVIKSIPYVVQPERIVPGISNYYASAIADGFDFASVLVRTREGRPIQILNNTMAGGIGKANARVNASVLSMYDNNRLQKPQIDGKDSTWAQLDTEVRSGLNRVGSKQIAILSQTFASPSTQRLIKEFKNAYPSVREVVYDAISYDAALEAYEAMYGERALADYDFSKVNTIVSVGADFLGDWQGGNYMSEYSEGRVPKNGKMSRHIQIESNMTLSGANADERIQATPSQQKQIVASLYRYALGLKSTSPLEAEMDKKIIKIASELRLAGSNAVLISGLDDKDVQTAVLAFNKAIGSKAFNSSTPRRTRQGNTKNVQRLIQDMNAGNVGALLIVGTNPLYSLPNAAEFNEGLKKVDTSVAFSSLPDETTIACKYVATTPHYLESWGDVEFKKGTFGLIQPTIRPIFDTRQFQDSLLKWSGSGKTFYDYVKETWTGAILGGASWSQALHDGVFTSGNKNINTTVIPVPGDRIDPTNYDTVTSEAGLASTFDNGNPSSQIAEEENSEQVPTGTTVNVNAALSRLASVTPSGGMELSLYTMTGMGDGQQAGNPWLQEFPDPITRASWDNYATVSAVDAEKLELENENVANGALNGSYVTIKAGDTVIKNVPVYIQPGQAPGTIGLALGYGKTAGVKDVMKVGVNAYPLYKDFQSVQSVTLEKQDGVHEFACVQLHNTLMGRGDIVKETTLEIFNTKDAHEWNHVPEVTKNHIEYEVTSPEVDIWEEFDRSVGHHFNLSIDLNACTGCGACVIACHAENNVPVVGKSEIRRSRDMHWLRIDRYYSSEDTFSGDNEKKENISGLGSSLSEFGEMEEPAGNPQVVFQPVMCQHCNHAPCETVCPVAASSHGRQGQNHMAYNRCVGTRYCANNCPYKVRRFNWFLYNQNDEFDFHMNNDLGRMVLNPDVTVRSRGVMEKCSLCIQLTQKSILDAKLEGRPVKDEEFQTACSRSCPTGAMQFGDINDTESEVFKLKNDERAYHLLEHVGTKPNVVYQVKVRNTREQEA